MLTTIYGLRIHGIVIFDETLNVIGGRYIDHHFPQALIEANGGVFPRGPERLSALLLAAGNLLSGRTATQLEAAHVALAAAYAAAAIPTYAIARLVGLGRWWAAGAGALAVCTPLLLFGATLLNTSLALLTAAVAFWAYLGCLLKPRWQADALAILATGLMATARVSYGGLGLALLIAVAIQAWRDAPGREAASRLLRDHWLLLGVAGVAVAYLYAHGVSQTSGYIGVSATPSFPAIWDHLRTSTGQLAVAYALAPFAIAIAWVVRSVLCPRNRATGAFALLVLATFVVLAYINQGGDLEDRYVVALLPLAAVAVVAPFARRELRWLEVGTAGLLVARVVATTQSTQVMDGFAHFPETTDTWFANVWLGRTTLLTGLSTSTAVTLLTVGAAAFSAALAVIARRAGRKWQWIAGAVLVATAVIGFAGAWYSAAKLVPSLPGLSTDNPALIPRSFVQAAFVDEHVHEPVGVLDYLTHESGLPQQWTAIEMFNARVQATVRIDGQSSGYTCCLSKGALLGLRIDQNTGTVTVAGGALPRYLLSAAQWTPGGLVTEPIATSPVTEPRVSLERTMLPLRAAWTGPGVPPDGWGIPGQTLRLRVFPATLVSLRRPCLNVALTAPSLPATGAVGVSAGPVRLAIPPGGTAIAQVPLVRAAKRAEDIIIRANRSGIRSDGARVTVGLSHVSVASCRPQNAM
ncbi:MAG TPA: hypothetical protein VIG42_01215 [Solirubrobacteraceae bacterium]